MFEFKDSVTIDLEEEKHEEAVRANRCFFDLEGSLSASSGDIVQFGGIVTDWDFNILDAYNVYFRNYKPISAKEFSIHKLDKEFLWNNSSGHFCESLDLIPIYPEIPTMFISYTTFDVRRVNEELVSYGLDPAPFGEEASSMSNIPPVGENSHFDLFKHGRKKGELLAKEIGEESINSIFKELQAFGKFENKGNHDALFDCVMLLALSRGMKYGRS